MTIYYRSPTAALRDLVSGAIARGEKMPIIARVPGESDAAHAARTSAAAAVDRAYTPGTCATCGESEAHSPAWAGTHRFGPTGHPFVRKGGAK